MNTDGSKYQNSFFRTGVSYKGDFISAGVSGGFDHDGSPFNPSVGFNFSLYNNVSDSSTKNQEQQLFISMQSSRIKAIDSIWLKECLSVKKGAFAADFVRLWAVFHEGGIYLDSDVLLHGS